MVNADRDEGENVVGENIFLPHKATERRLRRLDKIKAYIDGGASPTNVVALCGDLSSWLGVSPRTIRDDLLTLRGDLDVAFWHRNGAEVVWSRRALDRRAERPGDGSLDGFLGGID